MHAAIDECYKANARLYIVAAALPGSHVRRLRTATRAVIPQGRKRTFFHWREETPLIRHRLLVDIVTAHNVRALVMTRPNVAPKRQEAARRACLRALFDVLVPQGLDRVVMDLRRPAGLESIDRQTFLFFQKSGVLPAVVSYVFRQPAWSPFSG